ncbi:hypothetical protein DZF91_00970 [Actinomadura logoneensis]|uniref:SMP-30/Gluconolactonase/LRE-like region domain-containing protein n=1 Tax=Actinomadura logoneensis TaxID=2293572 RepID=A0A372JTW2_9ACTN|nr:hypothetical protein [Actinomadura logoneensis]RFU43473.1 hypothetical protein DZF91_00970 [Actinomadura logoneensis]
MSVPRTRAAARRAAFLARTPFRMGVAVLACSAAVATALGAASSSAANADVRISAAPSFGSSAAASFGSSVQGHAASLHPEGVAWDPTRGTFLVGSLRHGTVSVVRRDGTVRTLVDDPALVSTTGIRVDAPRRRLLVANADPGVGVKTSPATAKHLAGVGIYDLRTGRRVRYVDLAKVAGDGGEHFGNDMAVAPDGTFYVTDSFAPIVYRVPVRGRATVLVRDGRLAGGGGFGANGIVWQRNHLIVGNYTTGRLYRVPVGPKPSARSGAAGQGMREVRLAGGPLVGADGIASRPDGSLIVVTNKVASAGADAVFTVRPSRAWGSAAVVRAVSPWADPAPTAVAVTPGGRAYVLSGRLDVLFGGSTTDAFTLRRF